MDKYENIGLLFNKHYFNGLDYINLDSENNEDELKKQNKKLFASEISKASPPIADNMQSFKLETTYPGLFSGSGYAHEASAKGELKLGFYFDYTSGLPCIPGSSVKGVLRSAFQKAEGKYITSILKDLQISKAESINIKDLEIAILGHEKERMEESVYKRDVFFDAFPVSAPKGKFLGSDSLAPHGDNPLKNPIPLSFMKVMPQVEFEFQFLLHKDAKTGLTVENKKSLFKQILLDLGIGAKTNVGYGQFQPDANAQKRKKALRVQQEIDRIKQQEKEREANKSEAEKRIVKGVKLECKVVEITKKEVIFQFDWDKKIPIQKKKSKINIDLNLGDKVEIEIIEDFYLSRKVDFKNHVKKID